MVGPRSHFPTTRFIWAILALFFSLQSVLIFRLNLNWDEYFFLSHIHTFIADRPLDPMQTFHVQLLAWLPSLPLGDPDQIVVGRVVMLLCEVVALFCVYRIARQFTSAEAALVAVVAWCGAAFALTQGMSFRTDPLSGLFIMASLTLLFEQRLTFMKAIFAGLLAALALLVTIKASIFLPCFLAGFLWQMSEQSARPQSFAKFAAAGVSLLIVGGILWWWHSSSLTPFPSIETTPQVSSTARAAERSGSIFNDVIMSQELLPRWDYISRWLILSIAALIPIAFGLRATATRISADPLRATTLLLLALPIGSLLIYRNAFPYFFPFMMLPVAVLAANGWENLHRPFWRNVTLGGIAILIVAQFVPAIQQGQATQREIAAVAAKMFPGGTRYIDRNAMLPSFQKSGYFMSSWGVQGMVRSGTPALARVVDREQPPLVIANTPILEAALDPTTEWNQLRLLAEEEQALRESYIKHWGDIWIAGKELEEEEGTFPIRIAGTYTLECSGLRLINGGEMACGDTLVLNKGRNRWSGGPVILRWGNNIYRPAEPSPKEPTYYGF